MAVRNYYLCTFHVGIKPHEVFTTIINGPIHTTGLLLHTIKCTFYLIQLNWCQIPSINIWSPNNRSLSSSPQHLGNIWEIWEIIPIAFTGCQEDHDDPLCYCLLITFLEMGTYKNLDCWNVMCRHHFSKFSQNLIYSQEIMAKPQINIPYDIPHEYIY